MNLPQYHHIIHILQWLRNVIIMIDVYCVVRSNNHEYSISVDPFYLLVINFIKDQQTQEMMPLSNEVFCTMDSWCRSLSSDGNYTRALSNCCSVWTICNFINSMHSKRPITIWTILLLLDSSCPNSFIFVPNVGSAGKNCLKWCNYRITLMHSLNTIRMPHQSSIKVRTCSEL